MPGGRPKGTPKTGGRKKGTPNKSTAEIRTLAQKHGKDAIETLVDLMNNGETEQTRRAAASDLLDRGFGKPSQAIVPQNPDGTNLQINVIQFADSDTE